jgi:hypothetical protein|tara:strand:- start:546 stop:1085 length:540 start_codon:yes stop_codon:yes gene_type:complete
MKSNTITGTFFVVGALGPLIVYMLLGGVLDVLSTLQTELIASWILLSVPIAFMRTRDTMPTGIGKEMAQIGMLLLVIGIAGGMVADSFASVGEDASQEAIGRILWGTMFLGMSFTGLGYYLEEFFNKILSGSLGLLGCVGFLVIAIGGATDDNAGMMIIWPLWMLVMLILGVITLRKAE